MLGHNSNLTNELDTLLQKFPWMPINVFMNRNRWIGGLYFELSTTGIQSYILQHDTPCSKASVIHREN